MSNYTFEDYKKAIKAKYEEETEGEYSNNLSSPTTANLRKLCIKRFKSNNNRDDLTAFESFFDIPFNENKKNLFGDDEMNKLEAVKRFFLGKTENPTEDTIQLAAILVDLQPRPFREFRKQIDPEDLELFNDLNGTNSPNEVVVVDNWNDEIENEDYSTISKNDQIISNTINNEKPKEKDNLEVDHTIHKSKFNKIHYLAIGLVMLCIGAIVYITLGKKECMQWSQDHYELVDCDLKAEGFVLSSPVELLDKSVFDLKKVEVCDTTRCFDKNGNAIIWYAKTDKGVDYFNTHGRHPENGKSLRPVTLYILTKYKK